MSRYDGKPRLIVDLGEPRPHPSRDWKNGTPQGCDYCGQKHLKCAGHGHLKNGPKRPCNHFPMRGQTKCHLHGGKSRQAMATAKRRLDKKDAIEILGTLQFVVRKGTTVQRLQVAMDEAARWADERKKDVDALNGQLVTEETDRLGAHKLAIHPSVILYTEALDRVEKFLIAGAKLGLDVMRLELEKRQGDFVFDAFTRAIEATELPPEQAERMRLAFAAALRPQGELSA